MITSKGGFFSRQAFRNSTIDDIGEASEALESILESDPAPTPDPAPDCATGAAMPALEALVAQYIDRVRLLTWAVVLMAVVLVAKELKQ